MPSPIASPKLTNVNKTIVKKYMKEMSEQCKYQALLEDSSTSIKPEEFNKMLNKFRKVQEKIGNIEEEQVAGPSNSQLPKIKEVKEPKPLSLPSSLDSMSPIPIRLHACATSMTDLAASEIEEPCTVTEVEGNTVPFTTNNFIRWMENPNY